MDAIDRALSGINPRSRFYVDATGVATAIWLSSDIVQFREADVRPIVGRDETELHVLNQVVSTALEITRDTTTRYTSSVALDLDDDADTGVFEGTLEGDSNEATFVLEFRQDNGSYFPNHLEVNGFITGRANSRDHPIPRCRYGTGAVGNLYHRCQLLSDRQHHPYTGGQQR